MLVLCYSKTEQIKACQFYILVMKKPLYILLFILLPLLVFSQKKVKVNYKNPESVSLVFVKYFSQLEFDKCKVMITKESTTFLDFMKSMIDSASKEEIEKMKSESKENAKYIVSAKCIEKNDKASCVVCCDKFGKGGDENSITLKKVDGKWLVHMSKEEMMQENQNMEENPSE